MISWWTRISIILVCAFVAWLLMGCSTTDDALDEPPTENSEVQDGEDVDKLEPVEVLYQRALASFEEKNYKEAIEQFEEVERQHPYSEWAKRAQVMSAYTAYRSEDFVSAQATLDRFVKLHPNSSNTPYAYYLRALTYYDQITDVGRDQKTTDEARQALREVVSRYPSSDYARDARLKLELTEDHLAGKEMQIGRYYQKRQEYLAAANRFKYVVDQYQTTSHTPEALHRLVECYLLLGVKPEAQKYAAVLGHNYPDSEWYEFSYAMLKGDVAPELKKMPKRGTMDWLVPSF